MKSFENILHHIQLSVSARADSYFAELPKVSLVMNSVRTSTTKEKSSFKI